MSSRPVPRRRLAWVVLPLALATACTPSGGTSTSPGADPPATATSTITATPTAPPTTISPTTTGDVSPTDAPPGDGSREPSTVPLPPPATVPALDRSEEATMARLGETLDTLAAIGPRPAGSDAEAAAFAWLAETLLPVVGRPLGREAVPLRDGSRSENRWIALGRGDPHLLLGAHVDSVHGSPGIDDNGSGTAVLVELVRRLVDAPPRATVEIVFFGAEEVLAGYGRDVHHHGSRQMTARRVASGTLPDAMVSVDMVGVGADLYAVVYRDADPSTAEALAAAGAAIGVTVTVTSRGDISDHEAFARVGVPSAFLWRPDNPAWHTPADDHADLDLLLEDLALLERVIDDLGR